MDPNKTLEILRAVQARIDRDLAEGRTPALDDVQSLTSHFEALDTWLTGGAFLPEAWKTTFDKVGEALAGRPA